MTAGQTEAANEDGVAGGGDGFVDEDEMEMMDSELVAGDEEENEAVVVQLGEEMLALRHEASEGVASGRCEVGRQGGGEDVPGEGKCGVLL